MPLGNLKKMYILVDITYVHSLEQIFLLKIISVINNSLKEQIFEQ